MTGKEEVGRSKADLAVFPQLETITMRKVHLDTDLGGDIDDLCTLAMVLNWPAIAGRGYHGLG